MAVKQFTTPPIDIDQVKSLYTEMSKLVYDDMDKQWNENKINGSKYADTWAALMKAVVSDSLSAVVDLQKDETDADRCVKQADCDLKAAQKAKIDYETTQILPEQKAFTIRQTEGFDDNIRQKMFETQMNSWAMMYSSGIMGDVVPSIISETEATKLWKKLKAEANVA